MEKHEIVISQTGILFGDAKLTLFRIMQEHLYLGSAAVF